MTTSGIWSRVRLPRLNRAAFLAGLLLLGGSAHAQGPLKADANRGRGLIALKAGTIHLVEGGRVLTDGTILVRDGKIVAAGSDVAVPANAKVFDYGEDAVIVPGFVAAYSSYGTGTPSDRTASPGTRATDTFNTFRDFAPALAGGVTSAYIAPSDARLISGVGAIVKLSGDDRAQRIVNGTASVHGSIDHLARNTPGFWEPPVPATYDTGMGPSQRQLPRSTMGAIVALTELIDAVRSSDPNAGVDEYGAAAITELRELVKAGVPWRISAVDANEIRALLDFSREKNVPVIIEKALAANELVAEIAASELPVIFRVPYDPNSSGRDYGKDEDDYWPRFDVPAGLTQAGVRVAIACSRPEDLLFSAGLATRGGLDLDAALRAITLTPAELCGAADRVGSIRPGKDADFCILNGHPLEGYASVLATWVGGNEVHSASSATARASSGSSSSAAASSRSSSRPTVIEVDELHVGDGEVLRPGQVLLSGGKIREIGSRVSHPRGARVVRGRACMPGMIDAFGHLGLEGSRKVPSTDFDMSSIVSPGDDVDRRVASHGITTVVLTPRGASNSGAPAMAYKPAGTDIETQVLSATAALRVNWTEQNRMESGVKVKELLAKGAEYRNKWLEYEQAIAAWTPPPPAPPKESKDDEKAEKEEEKNGAEEEAKDDDKKSKKKKKKKDEELEPDPITGVWAAELDEGTLKMRLNFAAKEGSGEVSGNLRCARLSSGLIDVEGYWDREAGELRLSGLGAGGWLGLDAKVEETKLVGKATLGKEEVEFSAERTSKEYVVAGRSERRKAEEPEKIKDPKGKPKKPRLDTKLEPLRRAIEGQLAVVVQVDREDEILACVAAFQEHGIQPILYGARDAHYVAAELVGRIRGVLLSPEIRIREIKRGIDYRTPHSELQNKGIAVAFHSSAEEGAIDLPLQAAYAVANGMSPTGAIRALTSDAATMMSIDDRVGRLSAGLDGDVLLLDGPPFAPGTSVLRTWVGGEEVKP